MQKILFSVWPLFVGIAMLMVGNGLQNTLLGVRATMESFPTYATGIIMSMYYVGFLLGSHYTPKLIRGVGHIRVFAALASIGSITVLFHGLFPSELVWIFVRMLTGFCFAGLYIVIESWLNNAVDNKMRGQMMATYLVILYGSMAAGQYLLNLADPKGMDLFVVSSILVSFAVLPVVLSANAAPVFEKGEKVSMKQLWQSSPLGVFGLFASGMASACLFSIGPVYAAGEGFTLAQISTFMAVTIVGGVMLQFPIGWLSDKYDRRRVLIAVSALTALACLLAIPMAEIGITALYLAMFLIGGTALTIYGLSSAHTNDHLTPPQIVAASATMILVNGIGSIIGPVVSTGMMNMLGPWALFATMAVMYGSISVFGLYRTLRRPSVPLAEQGNYVLQPGPSTGILIPQGPDRATVKP